MDGARFHAVFLLIPLTEVHQVAVLQHDALGHAGGAGGIQQGEQVVPIGCRQRRVRRDGGQAGNVLCQQEFARIAVQQTGQVLVGNHQGGLRVLYHKDQAFRRIRGVKRLVARPGFQRAQGSGYHVFIPVNQHGHHFAPAYALLRQSIRNPVGGFVDLPVGSFHVPDDQRRRFGMLPGLSPEQGHDVVDLLRRGEGGQEAVQRVYLFIGNNIHLAEGFPAQKFIGGFFIGLSEAFHAFPVEKICPPGNPQTVSAARAEHLGYQFFLGVVALDDPRNGLAAQEIHRGLHLALIGKEGGNGQMIPGTAVGIGI